MSIPNPSRHLLPGDYFSSCAKIGLGSCSVLCEAEHVTSEQSLFYLA